MSVPAVNPEVILLRGDWTPNKHIEKIVAAGQTIYPGMFCSLNASDQAIVAVAPANGVRRYIAIEDACSVNAAGTGGRTVRDPYLAGERIRLVQCDKGDHVLARLKGGENVTRTTGLIIENGLVIAGSSPENQDIIAYPRDPFDNSAALTSTNDFLAVVVA